MQGTHPRFPTKKALREAVALDPSRVSLEATSLFGNEHDGSLDNAPDGTYYVVGPDPHTNRKWYAQIRKSGNSLVVK